MDCATERQGVGVDHCRCLASNFACSLWSARAAAQTALLRCVLGLGCDDEATRRGVLQPLRVISRGESVGDGLAAADARNVHDTQEVQETSWHGIMAWEA